MRRFLLPRRIFLHASARLDYKYYVIAAALRAGMLGSMVISSAAVAGGVIVMLTGAFGASAPLAVPLYVILPLATVVQVVLFDLGYWIAHRTLHEIPLLWEFHKTHHAAEVLTPLTAARAHPVEDLIQTNFVAATLGFGYGVLVYLFGEKAQPLTLLETNVVFFVYFLTIYHLRHSHIWLPIRGWLGYIIQSPAHHHIHHSTAPQASRQEPGLLPFAVGLGVRHALRAGQARSAGIRPRRRKRRVRQREGPVAAAVLPGGPVVRLPRQACTGHRRT